MDSFDKYSFNTQYSYERQKEIQCILNRIEKIEQKLILILQKLESIETGTNKMSSHVDFIDDVYRKVKTPLFWICNRVDYIRGFNLNNSDKKTIVNSTINDQD